MIFVLAMVLPAETFAAKPSKIVFATATASVDLCPGITTFDLVAGQTNDVGDVYITKATNGDLIVEIYVTKPSYYMTSAAVAWSLTEAGLPHSKGGLIPGQFKDYKAINLLYSDYQKFTIPASKLPAAGTQIYLAVHTDTNSGGLDTYNEVLLPSVTDSTTFTVVNPSADSKAYFGVTINGVTYHGWCVDIDHGIPAEGVFKFNMYLSTDTASIPAGIINNPENLSIINWIINQNYVGKTSSAGSAFTYSDVQQAMWYFVDDAQSTNGLGEWSQVRVDEIIAAAAGHANYVPGTGNKVAIIIKPVAVTMNGIEYPLNQWPLNLYLGQTIIIELETGGANTAWAGWFNSAGVLQHPYPGSSWSTYVHYTV